MTIVMRVCRFILALLLSLLYADNLPAQNIAPATLSLSDTTSFGAIELHALEGWQFSFDAPDHITNSINLRNAIPGNIQDMGELRKLPDWNNYGWFEIEFDVDSSLAGLPRMMIFNNNHASNIWFNGRQIIRAGNPSPNPNDEVLARFINPAFSGIMLNEGSNHILIEFSGHTLSKNFTRFRYLEDGLHLMLFPFSEPSDRHTRAYVFGGGSMLLLLLVLIHSFLAYKFRNEYHLWVSLTTLFLLIHIFAAMSDTLIDWSYAYLPFFEYAYAITFIIAMYFFLIAVRSIFSLDIPWRTLTSLLAVSVLCAIISIYISEVWLDIVQSVTAILIIIYGVHSLVEARRISSSSNIWIIAGGLIVTMGGAALYVIIYHALGYTYEALFLTAIILAYTGLPVALTFTVANNYANLIDTLETKVKDRTAELEAAREYQNRFFANISHEFRTPLTIGEGMVNKLLRVKAYDPPKVRHDLSVVKRNMSRLNDMVNQIIDLTKSDENHLTLNRKYYKADSLASISVESFRSLAEYHGHRYEFHPNADDVILYADRSKVEIMINNLISNAIKFTKEGGTIIVKTSAEEGQFILAVMDSGSGIPAGQEEIIFERFHRIKREDHEYVEGMGVGLELSRTLARMHDGDILALTGVENGAIFTLSLPIATPEHLEETLLLESLDDEYLPPDQFLSERVKQDQPSKNKILIVEDNDDMMEYVSEIVADLGTIKKARNGKEALEMLDNFTPDVIITDLMMPVMGGLELVETLKKHEKWNIIPVMVLTAKALEEDKLHLLRIGVVDYITKPFDPEQLVLKIRNLLIYYSKRKEFRLEIPSEQLPDTPFLAEKTAAYIRENLRNTSLTVEILADQFSQSRRSFYRNLQLETGMTPAEFIREVRLVTARSIISNNKNMLLKELADAVGYKSVTSFRKVYKERFGEHPLD